jgi:hypothetical protein
MTHDPMRTRPKSQNNTTGGSLWCQDTLGERPCRSPVVTGRRRCRMHGGAPGSGGPKGPRNGNYKHGRYTAEVIASRRWLRQLTRDVETASALRTSQHISVWNE